MQLLTMMLEIPATGGVGLDGPPLATDDVLVIGGEGGEVIGGEGGEAIGAEQ